MEFNDQYVHGTFALEGSNAPAHELSSSGKSPPAGVIVPVILSGGGGSRLWPFSTKEMPKQFLPLVGTKSLFEEALDRVGDRSKYCAPIVVGSAIHADLCERSLLLEEEAARLVLEPCARNTAPAVIMAAEVCRGMHGDDALLLVMPSDHLIKDTEAFHEAVVRGEAGARSGRLVTFGIQPSEPDTGYGYLQIGQDLDDGPGVKEVIRFVEKPVREVAEAMVASGDYLWNAGIFLFRVGTLLEEAERTCPAIVSISRRAVETARCDGIRVIPEEEIFADCPSESIDYAVMELSSQVAVVPMAPGWSDLGSWDALASLVGTGSPVGPITTLDCESCYIHSDGVQVAALGVRDLIIVASGGRLLIMPRGRSQEVKELLSAMDSMAA